jgi:hypothetical protein
MKEDEIRQTLERNLIAWQRSGVVKTLKVYSADDAAVCDHCKPLHTTIIEIGEGKVGSNLPPLTTCLNKQCRCYFRPYSIS